MFVWSTTKFSQDFQIVFNKNDVKVELENAKCKSVDARKNVEFVRANLHSGFMEHVKFIITMEQFISNARRYIFNLPCLSHSYGITYNQARGLLRLIALSGTTLPYK